VVRLAESIAEDTRGDRIDVNSIAPGALNTRLLDEVLEAGPDRVGKGFYEKSRKQKRDGGASLERGTALAVFLASSASDGITGKLLSEYG
jgi:NAD(P)-dependent dehydrogenase (short-subunit alcohol dehydrogenase family)